MTDKPGLELPYGHFGTAAYKSEEKAWFFLRDFLHGSDIRPIGEPETIVEAQHVEQHILGQPGRPTLTELAKQARGLVHAHPDLETVTSILPSFLRTSEAVIEASTRYDFSRGSLLAFGSIPSEQHHNTVPVIAFTSGVSSDNLRLVEMQHEKRGWDDSRHAWAEIATIGCHEASWHSLLGPIQQIVFSQTFDRGVGTECPSFIGVRCATKTTIFRPVLHDHNSDDLEDSSSRLHVSPVFEVSIFDTNDQIHIDVAFNPWYTRQFAIINILGEWDIWDLGSRQKYSQVNVSHARIASASRVVLTGDGWARILWVNNPTMLLICTRSVLELYNVASAERIKITALGVADIITASHIMNIALLPGRPTHFCILTSTHLVVLHVRQTVQTGSDGAEFNVLLKLTHFWNQNDVTVNMALSAIDEHDTLILMYSNATSTVTAYRIHIEADSCTLLTDPQSVNSSWSIRENPYLVDVHVRKVRAGHDGERWKSNIDKSLAARLERENVRLLALTALYPDGTITQSLLADSTRTAKHFPLMPPTWRTPRAIKSAPKVKKTKFVVGDTDVNENRSLTDNRLRPLSRYRNKLRVPPAAIDVNPWIVNYERVSRSLGSQEDSGGKHADVTLDLAEQQIRNLEILETSPYRTLFELGQEAVASADNIENLSARLNNLAYANTINSPSDDLVTIGEEKRGVHVHTLTWNHDLQNIYQHMIGDWISPLSTRVHGHLRLTKDGVLRKVAAEIAFATKLFRPNIIDEPGNGLSTSGHATSPTSSHQNSMLPTPSPTATSSAFMTPSISASQDSTVPTSAEMMRLTKYTTFTPPSTAPYAPSSLPRSLANIVSHWSLGADPYNYKYLESLRRVIMQQHQDDEDDEDMGEDERIYARKKVERHLRRQRREAEDSAQRKLQSSQAAVIMSSQLPVRPKGSEGSRPLLKSSQALSQGGTELMTASQIVPGRFGGRPDHPPRRKKRKQGF